MRISAHDYIFSCRDLSAAQTVPLLGQAGLFGIEVMQRDLVGEAGRKLQDALATSAVEVVGFSHNVNCDAPDALDGALEEIQAALPLAAHLGGKHLGLSVLSSQPNPHPATLREQQARAVRRIAEAASRFGLRVNLHTYAPDGEDQFRKVRELAELLDESVLDMGPDLNWLTRGGADPVEFLRYFGKRVRFCHLRDEKQGVWTDALGDGEFPLVEVMRTMRECCAVDECVIELALPPERVQSVDLVDIHRRSLEAVKRAIDQP